MKITPQTKEDAQQQLGDIHSYDKYIVCFSGGKDSAALFLHLLDKGVDKSKIELWHHDIDGGDNHFMDWPITKGYVDAFAKAFSVPVYYSWREGGFKREMLRNRQTTGNILFEDDNKNLVCIESKKGERYENTRRRFPQTSANLSVRWCSAYLKIDVCASAIRNQDRFKGIKTIVLTGERAEESTARSKYNIFEKHRTDLRNGRKARHVDHWRPIRDWDEGKVWNIIRKYGVRPHPAYEMGFGRVSCMKCIFASANQWASISKIDPKGLKELSDYESEFGVTIRKGITIEQLVQKGTPYDFITTENSKIAMSTKYEDDILVGRNWRLPHGAFGESCGPT